jgi:hypothetical protein
MNLQRRLVLLLIAVTPQLAPASEKTYIDMVGKLFGSIESPRVIRDFCAAHSPGTAGENARLYDDWALRNRDLLNAAAVQVAHADARLKHHEPRGDVESFDQIRTNMRNKLEEELQLRSAEWIVKFCSVYPKLIENKDEEVRSSIRPLLSTIEEADKKLAAREQT